MTKNRLLPDTDLARMAFLTEDRKKRALRGFRDGYSKLSYAPFRDAVPGIFNARKSLFEKLPGIEWSQVESAIKRSCRSRPDWLKSNLALAEALYKFNEKAPHDAIEREFMSVPIGFGARLKLWHDFYYIQDGRPVMCFIDPRRANGLTETARQFVFSVMKHNLATGDFSEARFQIFQLPPVDIAGIKRKVVVHNFDDAQLLPASEVNAAISDTYKIWLEVLEEGEQEVRRAASGGSSGGFNF